MGHFRCLFFYSQFKNFQSKKNLKFWLFSPGKCQKTKENLCFLDTFQTKTDKIWTFFGQVSSKMVNKLDSLLWAFSWQSKCSFSIPEFAQGKIWSLLQSSAFWSIAINPKKKKVGSYWCDLHSQLSKDTFLFLLRFTHLLLCKLSDNFYPKLKIYSEILTGFH